MTNHKPDDEAIFKVAREIKSSDARDAYLEQVCTDDQELRARVISLLRVEEEQPCFLESPISVIVTTEDPLTEQAGVQIGPYKLLEQIGEGGMGVVYMAEQQVPVRRRVALKIIKPGMDSRQVIARFEAERQALALMDHPNIARVLEAGTTDTGRPYFVMELVRGVPITEYCDQANLSVRDRLELFVQVCHAVQHAHQKGIIHRDLKPSNVLITLHDGRPVPKVIDFGVAKATNQQLTEKTLFTNFSQMIGTPLYMSPEQAEMSGLDVDTRSDIYSLGVLLFELLTGTTPFDRERLRQAPFDEIRRIIREEDPPKPSAAIDTLGRTRTTTTVQRAVEPYRFSQLLRGDLDWIVMKALEKDRSRRYVSADGLARDVERYLHDEPVEAHSPSAIYRLRKFARRNRAALITAVLVSTALIVGTATSTWQAVRAWHAERLADAARLEETRQRRIAEDQRNEAEKQRGRAEANFQQARKAVDDYLTAVSQSKLFDVPGSQPLRKELLDSALAYYKHFIDQHADDPTVQAELAAAYLRVGDITSAMGAKDQALEAIQKGADAYEHLANDRPEVAAYQAGLASALNERGVVERALGRLPDTEVSCRRALAIYETLAREYPEVDEYRDGAGKAQTNLGVARSAAGRTAEAEASYRSAIEIYQQFVRRHPEVRTYRADLANALYHLGHLQRAAHELVEAKASFQQAGQVYETLAAEDDRVATYLLGVAHAQYNLGIVNRALGQATEAADANQRARVAYDQLGSQNPTVASYKIGLARSCYNLGLLQSELGQPGEAQQSWISAAAAYGAAAELGYSQAAASSGLADSLAMQGRWQDAADAYADVALAGNHALKPLVRLALLYAGAGNDAEYQATCAELLRRYGEQANALDALSIAAACTIGEHAVEDLPKAIEIAQRAVVSDPDNPACRAALGVALFRTGQTEKAIATLKEALPLLAAAEQSAPQQLDRIQTSRLAAETILALAYDQQQDQQSLATQIQKLQRLVENQATRPPKYSEGTDSWLVPLWIHIAQRELRQLTSPTAAPGESR